LKASCLSEINFTFCTFLFYFEIFYTCGSVICLSEYLCYGISCQIVYILAKFVFDNLYQSRSISELSNSPD
ncbi:hypothetical protein T07_1991, partial [Trichinella nelsoni]